MNKSRAARSMGRSMPWQLVGLAGFTVVALLIALIIKDRGGGAGTEELLHAAPDAVEATGTAQVTMKVEVDTDEANGTVDGEGAVDVRSGAGWYAMEAGGQRIEVRTNGKTVYVLAPDTTTWLAAKVEEVDALGALGSGPNVAIAFVDLLKGDAEVEDLGREKVGTIDARHLRATVEVKGSNVLAVVAEKEGSLPIEVWLDDEGRPIRERLRGVVEGGFPIVITLDLSDFGSKLGVAIPPEGAVRDVEGEELAQLLGSRTDSG